MSKWIRLYSDEDFTTGAGLPASGTILGARHYNTTNSTWYSWNGAAWEAEGGGSGGHTITEGDAPLTARANLDFDATAFNVADDVANDATDVTLNFGTGAGQPAAGDHNHDAAYAPIAHVNSTDGHPVAVGGGPGLETAGLMSGPDKTKLDGVDDGAVAAGVAGDAYAAAHAAGVDVSELKTASGTIEQLSSALSNGNIDGAAPLDIVRTVDSGTLTPAGTAGQPNLPQALVDELGSYLNISAGGGDVSSSETTGTTVNGSLAVFADANGKTIRESNDGTGSPINESALSAILVTPSAPGVLLYDATGNPVVTASPATSGLPLVGKGTGAIPAFEALNIAAISVSGGSPGQIPKINGGGTALEWAADATGGGGGGGPNYAASYTQIADAGTPSVAGQFAVNVGSSADPTAVTRFRFNVTDADGVPQGDFFGGLSANHYFRMWNAADPTEWITYRITSAGGTTYRDLNVTFVARDAGDTVLASGKTWNFHFYSQDSIKRYSQTSYIRHDAYGPNYITYDSATGNLTHHGTTEPGTTSTLATAVAGVPITWGGIVVPATATGGTIKRVSIGGLLTGATGTAQAIVLKMSAAGTKTDTSKAVQPAGTSFKTTVTCSASTWTDTDIGINSASSLAAGDTFGVLIGEFTQFSGGPTPYWFRITYEWEVIG